jgi:Na+/H+-dicarboxylate symporter
MEASVAHKRLTARILVAMMAGLILGLLLSVVAPYPDAAARAAGETLPWVHAWISDGLLHIVGQAFVRGLQLLVVPVVLVSLTLGTAALDDVRKLGRGACARCCSTWPPPPLR